MVRVDVPDSSSQGFYRRRRRDGDDGQTRAKIDACVVRASDLQSNGKTAPQALRNESHK